MARTVLYGLDRTGAVLLTEVLERVDENGLHKLAEARLPQFERVEVWVQSVCVVRLQRA